MVYVRTMSENEGCKVPSNYFSSVFNKILGK